MKPSSVQRRKIQEAMAPAPAMAAAPSLGEVRSFILDAVSKRFGMDPLAVASMLTKMVPPPPPPPGAKRADLYQAGPQDRKPPIPTPKMPNLEPTHDPNLNLKTPRTSTTTTSKSMFSSDDDSIAGLAPTGF